MNHRLNSFIKGFLFLLLGCLPVITLQAKVEVGAQLPDLSQFELKGVRPALEGKVVIIDFWASWCAPCLSSFPAMQELQKRYKDQGVEILAISVDEKEANKDRFLKKLQFEPLFTLLHDTKQKTAAHFSPENMPTTYIYDKGGRLRFVHAGFHGAKSIEQYISNIETLLKE